MLSAHFSNLPLVFKFSFHCLFIIRYDLALSSISKILTLKRPRFVSIDTFSTVPFFKFNLHLVSRNFLTFLINAVIIIFALFLFINIITSSPFTYTLIITIMISFVKYDTHNNLDFLIISIDFLCLRYQLDKFLLDSYIRHLSS